MRLALSTYLLFIFWFSSFCFFRSVHGTISVISEETNETVRVIYEKNIRAVSDAVEGYVIISSPLNACEAVDPAPVRRRAAEALGNDTAGTTEDSSLYAFEEEDRVERDWILLSIVYDCDVTTKARNAQLGGYKALIIQNIGSNDSQHVPWHILRFPLVKMNHVVVGEYDGDLLRFNFSYPNNKFYVRFEEDKFYQLMCYILIGIIMLLLTTMFALFWFQICCAILIVAPHQFRLWAQHWLNPGKRRLTRPMLQLLPVKTWSSSDPFQACAICQEDFKEQDKIRVLPCLHGFHPVCVDPWLLRRSRQCPCCMQCIRLPRRRRRVLDDEEDPLPLPQRPHDDTQSPEEIENVEDGSTCRGVVATSPVILEPPVNPPLELTQSPQSRVPPKPNENSDSSCTITSPSSETQNQKSSQDKTLDWQLRRFLKNFNHSPSDPTSTSKLRAKEKRHKSAEKTQNGANSTTVAEEPLSITLPNSQGDAKVSEPPRLLETSLDQSQSCSTSTDLNDSTLEVMVGTVAGEDNSSYHLSSPYPMSSQTFTVSTTRDRKHSDSTTISGSLPRDELSFHNTEEIHSEIISEEVFRDEEGERGPKEGVEAGGDDPPPQSPNSEQTSDTTETPAVETSAGPTKLNEMSK